MRWSAPLLVMMLAVGNCQAKELHAGAASVDITPPTGFPMWGYASRHDAPSEGVLDRLFARALVLKAGDEGIALVGLDLGRAPVRDSYERIRQQVKQRTGIEHLFLVASHTHHGPILELNGWPSAKKSYVHELEKKLVEVIDKANKARKPARLGVTQADGRFNRNRQWRKENPPVDRVLIVMRVEDKAGKPIAHAVNLAAHPTMLERKLHKFAADFVGPLCARVEKKTGAPCLFLQGACGDLAPQPRDGQGPRAFGLHVAQLVLDLIKKIDCDIATTTIETKEESFTFKGRLNLSNVVVRGALGLAFYPELVTFYEQEYRGGVRPTMSVALINNTIGIVGVSGEFFCDHAVQLRRRAGLKHLLFLGYCNDYQQYFPTIEAAAQGGYGTEPYIASAEIGAGEKMMNRALILLLQMRGKLKK